MQALQEIHASRVYKVFFVNTGFIFKTMFYIVSKFIRADLLERVFNTN